MAKETSFWKQAAKALLFLLACGAFCAPTSLVGSESSKPISYQPPKEQARAEIKWVKPICVEKDRYIGWPTVCRLANGDILTVFYQQLAPDEKPCLMATRWRVRQ